MSEKTRILFVDDEPNVLSGLRRMLRPMRDEWEMTFAESGPAALALLEAQGPIDVVVSDMRMPGMDGAALLEEVKRRWPQTARFLLSGQANDELTLKAVGPAHQFLAKPCDADTIISSVRRARRLCDRVPSGSLAGLVGRLDRLPSPPRLYQRLVKEMDNPDTSVQQVGRLIQQDPAMAAKILQLVNSSFFSMQRQITNPVEAAVLLGVRTIRSLALTLNLFSQFDDGGGAVLDMGELQEHCVVTAQLARRIVEHERGGRELADDALLGGLVHDLGKLVLAVNLPQQYREAIALSAERGQAVVEAEREVYGATHADVGAYLLSLWGLPAAAIDAVALHHPPSTGQSEPALPIAAVQVANILAHELKNQDVAGETAPESVRFVLPAGLAERAQQWRAVCQQAVTEGTRA